MERSRGSGFRAAARLLVLAIGVFLLLELTARLYLFGLGGLHPERVNSIRGLPQTGFTRPAPPASGRGFDLKPGIDGYFKNVPFRTNSAGLRDREYSLHKPENTFRVAVLGASFALPAGVAIEDAFHSRLEERFSAEFAPRRYEFINFAVGMYSPRQVMAMLETRALDYSPDLLLVTATSLSMPWLVGDPPLPSREDAADGGAGLRDHFRTSYPVLQSFFLRLLLHRTGHGPDSPQTHVGILEGLVMDAIERFDPTNPPTPEAAAAPAGRLPPRDRRPILDRLARLRAVTGIPVAVVRLEFDPAERTPLDRAAEARARSLSIPYLDTRDAFDGMDPSRFWIFEFDPHPDARAHGIFAESVARFLVSNDLIPR